MPVALLDLLAPSLDCLSRAYSIVSTVAVLDLSTRRVEGKAARSQEEDAYDYHLPKGLRLGLNSFELALRCTNITKAPIHFQIEARNEWIDEKPPSNLIPLRVPGSVAAALVVLFGRGFCGAGWVQAE